MLFFVTICAQHLSVEQTSICRIAYVMELKEIRTTATFTTIFGAREGCLTHVLAELPPHQNMLHTR